MGMTHEEAINRLEDTFEAWERWNPHNDSPSSKLSEALGVAIAALREQDSLAKKTSDKKTSEWISVEERLPEGWWIDPDTGYGEPEEYLVFVKGAMAPTVANYIDGKFVNLQQDATGFADVITHWMPLPEPPEEDT